MSFARRLEGMGLDPVIAEVDLDGAQGPRRRHRAPPQPLRDRSLLQQPAGAADPGHGTAGRSRTRWWSRRLEGLEELPPTPCCSPPAPGPASPTGARPTASASSPPGDCYPPPVLPEHAGRRRLGRHRVEFVHMFSSLGSQGDAGRQPPAGAAGQGRRGGRGARGELPASGASRLLKGARASASSAPTTAWWCAATTAAWCGAPTPCWPSARCPTPTAWGWRQPASRSTPAATSPSTTTASRNVPHIYAAGDLSGKLPLSSVASMQGRKIAEHVMGLHTREHRHLDYDKAASAIFTEPEIADVGLAEADAFAMGRKIRVTKVPFSATPRRSSTTTPAGFVKIVSDPATGVVLGGSIVGRHAAELISVHRPGGHGQPQGHRHRGEPARAPRRCPRPWPKPPSELPRAHWNPRARPGRVHAELASIGHRFAARLVDGLILLVPALLLTSWSGGARTPTATSARAAERVRSCSAWPAVYEIADGRPVGARPWARSSCARRWCGPTAAGRCPRWARACIRYLLPAVVAGIPCRCVQLASRCRLRWALWDPQPPGPARQGRGHAGDRYADVTGAP